MAFAYFAGIVYTLLPTFKAANEGSPMEIQDVWGGPVYRIRSVLRPFADCCQVPPDNTTTADKNTLWTLTCHNEVGRA